MHFYIEINPYQFPFAQLSLLVVRWKETLKADREPQIGPYSVDPCTESIPRVVSHRCHAISSSPLFMVAVLWVRRCVADGAPVLLLDPSISHQRTVTKGVLFLSMNMNFLQAHTGREFARCTCYFVSFLRIATIIACNAARLIGKLDVIDKLRCNESTRMKQPNLSRRVLTGSNYVNNVFQLMGITWRTNVNFFHPRTVGTQG